MTERIGDTLRGMVPEELRKRYRSMSIQEIDECRLYAMDDELRYGMTVLRRKWPGASVRDCVLLNKAVLARTRSRIRYDHWTRDMFETAEGWEYYRNIRGPMPD